MVVPLIASLFYFVWFNEYTFARFVYGGTKVFTLVWPVIAVWWVFHEKLPKWSFKDSLHWRALPVGLGAGLLIVLIAFALMRTPVGEMVRGSSGRISAKVNDLGIMSYYWSFAVFLSVFHSLIEEYYWRWFVFGQLARLLPATWAHALAGLSFSAHHIVIATQYFPFAYGVVLGLFVGVGGVIWSLLYARQKTLTGAWICHMAVDFGIMIIGYNLLNPSNS